MIRNCAKISPVNRFCSLLYNRECNLSSLYVTSPCNVNQNQSFCKYSLENNLVKLPSFCPVKQNVRHKSKGQRVNADSGSDDEDSDEEGDFDADGGKIKKSAFKSMRLDSMLSKVFGLTRRRTDEVCFGNRIKINDKLETKKSYELEAGDKVELYEDAVDTGIDVDLVARMVVKKVVPTHDSAGMFVTYSFYKEKNK